MCGNCQCIECLGPPCLSPLSRPPLCNSCNFRHGPTYTQCSLTETVIAEPFTADDIEVAVNELSPRSNQSIERATMSPMINALTNAAVAPVIATVEEDTEVAVPRRTTRSQSFRLNLAATFEGFVPANNPNAWRDRDLGRTDLQVLTDPYLYPSILSYNIHNHEFIYVIDICSY